MDQVKTAYEEYASAVGAVAHASNYLQERLGQLFSVVAGTDRGVALAMWYSLTSDRNQRGLLRAAVVASKDDRWLPRLPKVRDDIMWLVDRGNEFGNRRNDAIHTPCSLFVGEEGHEIAAAFLYGNPKALALRGQEIVKEFKTCAAYAERLCHFSDQTYSALVSAAYPWPKRPELPDLLPKNNPPDQPRPPQPKSSTPQP